MVSDGINEKEIWDDTLFMVVLFLGHYGTVSGRQDLVDEAVRQFLLHARYLNDPQTGLWFHGWSFAEKAILPVPAGPEAMRGSPLASWSLLN